MALDFPSSPVNGQTFGNYTYDSTAGAWRSSSVVSGVPSGCMMQFLGTVTQTVSGGVATATGAPTGWILCDGSAVGRLAYASLFAVIGTTYGAGDGSTTFNLPDLRGRVPLGVGTGTDTNSTSQSFSLGAKSGEFTHTLSTSEMPSHNHSGSTADGATLTGAMNFHGAGTRTFNAGSSGIVSNGGQRNSYPVLPGSAGSAASFDSWSVNASHGHSLSIASNGGGAAHNNLQPYITVNYILKI
jgi:microcystin-dependent protein